MPSGLIFTMFCSLAGCFKACQPKFGLIFQPKSLLPPPAKSVSALGATQLNAGENPIPFQLAQIQTGTGAGVGSEDVELQKAKQRHQEDPITSLKILPGGWQW